MLWLFDVIGGACTMCAYVLLNRCMWLVHYALALLLACPMACRMHNCNMRWMHQVHVPYIHAVMGSYIAKSHGMLPVTSWNSRSHETYMHHHHSFLDTTALACINRIWWSQVSIIGHALHGHAYIYVWMIKPVADVCTKLNKGVQFAVMHN